MNCNPILWYELLFIQYMLEFFSLQKCKYFVDNYILGVPLSGVVVLLSFLLLCVVMCVYQAVNEMYGESLSAELDDLPLHSGQYHMTEFAKKYFREAQRNRRLDTHIMPK